MSTNHEQLSALHEKLLRKRKVQAMLNDLQFQLSALQEKERQLAIVCADEQADVDRLERVSLSSVFYALLSRKEEKLEKERAEAYAAALKYDDALKQIASMERALSALSAELKSLSGVEQEYARVLDKRSAALKAENSTCGAELFRIEERLSAIEAELRELGEARRAGQSVQDKLFAIEKELGSAEGWGTWDLVGGGLITDLVKHSHMDEAQSHINALQSDLYRYRAELADVALQLDIQVSTDGFLSFADYFFDDIFSSWAVLDRIGNARQTIDSAGMQVAAIQEKLALRKADLENEAQALRRRYDETVLRA